GSRLGRVARRVMGGPDAGGRGARRGAAPRLRSPRARASGGSARRLRWKPAASRRAARHLEANAGQPPQQMEAAPAPQEGAAAQRHALMPRNAAPSPARPELLAAAPRLRGPGTTA